MTGAQTARRCFAILFAVWGCALAISTAVVANVAIDGGDWRGALQLACIYAAMTLCAAFLFFAASVYVNDRRTS